MAIQIVIFRLRRTITNAMKTQPAHNPVDPLWKVMEEGPPAHAKRWFDTQYSERLKKTGREEGLKLIEQKHPEFFVKAAKQ